MRPLNSSMPVCCWNRGDAAISCSVIPAVKQVVAEPVSRAVAYPGFGCLLGVDAEPGEEMECVVTLVELSGVVEGCPGEEGGVLRAWLAVGLGGLVVCVRVGGAF